MEAKFQNLNVSLGSEEIQSTAAEFIKILDATRKRKQVVKILKAVGSDSKFFVAIEKWLCQKMSSLDSTIPKKISALLELSSITQDIIKRNFKLLCTYIVHFLSILCDEEESRKKFPNNERYNESSILMVKLCLQILQFLPEETSAVLLSKDVNEENKKQLESMFSCILTVLCVNRFTKECSLLAGTTIALLFNLCERNKETLSSITKLMLILDQKCSKQNACITTGNISMNCVHEVSSIYSPLILINGFVRISTDLLLENTGDNKLLLDSMFELINAEHFTDPVSKYLRFDTLVAWMSYVHSVGIDNLLAYYNDNRGLFLSNDSGYCHQILELVWNHIEDLVDGIPACVKKIFALLLKLHNQERCLHVVRNGECENKFIVMLTDDILNRAWHEKGRWLLLAELIPFITTEQLFLRHPYLAEEMIRCTATCGLSAISNEVYQVILKDIRNSSVHEITAIKNWSTHFNKPIMEALRSDNVLVRQNIGQYWIPSTVRFFPNCLLVTEQVMRSKLFDDNDTVDIFHGYIMVVKSCRNFALIKNDRLEQCKDILSKGLQHSDLDVRIETFNTLCCNPKKTEPLPVSFHHVLLNFVDDNLNNDSSKFRQQMLSSLKKLLINIRDSCIMLHRTHLNEQKKGIDDDSSKDLLIKLIDFIEALLSMSKSTLHPGVLFQRKKTGLLLFQLLSELFIYIKEESLRKKGAALDTTESFFKFISDNDYSFDTCKWKILSTVDTELLSCIQDQHDEVRELALDILNYHQIISNDQLLSKKESFDATIKIAHNLLDSPKYHEAESGAIIMRFIMTRLIGNKSILTNLDDAHTFDMIPLQCEDMNSMVLCYMLLKRGQDFLQLAYADVLSAACYRPIFGILLAFSQILTCFKTLPYHASICPLIKELVMFCDSVSSITLNLLSGTYFEKNNLESCHAESSPSFADIGEALDVALKTCPSYSVQSEVVGHLHCRELLQSFCWLNLKAVSLVISQISNLLPSINDNEFVLQNLKLIYKFYNNTLIKCRHKGVIETSYLSLTTFSKNVASITVYWKEIATWCFDTIQSAVDFTQNASVTKRSAGIPLFIQAILSAEPANENNNLLHRCMRYLLDVAKTELPKSVNSNFDLPQFNALNMMRAVFRDASLGNVVLPFVEDAVMLTINGFSSPSWSIRNASTILLGTLVPRMLGQRISREESNLQNTSTVDVFFYRYPKLVAYFQNCLDSGQSKKDGQHGANFIAPHIIPALTFLSKLSSSSKDKCSKLTSEFLALLYSFTASPVFAIRELATSSIITFTPEECYADLTKETLSSLQKENNNNNNKIHSLCMVLLKTIKTSKNSKTICSLIHEHYEKQSCIPYKKNCDLLSQGVVIDIIMECYHRLKTGAVDVLYQHLEEKILFTKQLQPVSVGRPIFLKSLSKAVLLLLCEDTQQELSCKMLKTLLDCRCNDLHIYFFKYINDYVEHLHDSLKNQLFHFTVKHILESQCRMLLEASILCFSLIVDNKMFLGLRSNFSFLERLFQLLDKSVRLVPYLLPSIEKLLGYSRPTCISDKQTTTMNAEDVNLEVYVTMSTRLANNIIKYSCTDQDENLRCAAAKSLGLLWQLVMVYMSCKHTLLNKAIHQTLTSAMDLLQDEDEIVRHEANNSLQFVNRISVATNCAVENRNIEVNHCNAKVNHCNDVQCNITLRNLLKLAELNALKEEMYFSWLVDMLNRSNPNDFNKTNNLMLFEQEASNLYAEEIVIIDLVYHSLQTVLTNLSSEPTALQQFNLYCNSTKESCHMACKKCIDWLKLKHENYRDLKNVYGLFGSRRCFITLYKVLKYLTVVSICLSVEEKKNIKGTYVNDLVVILGEYLLHPLIKENLDRALCGYSVT